MSVKEKSSQQISGRLQEGQQENTKTILIPYEQINSFYCKNGLYRRSNGTATRFRIQMQFGGF